MALAPEYASTAITTATHRHILTATLDPPRANVSISTEPYLPQCFKVNLRTNRPNTGFRSLVAEILSLGEEESLRGIFPPQAGGSSEQSLDHAFAALFSALRESFRYWALPGAESLAAEIACRPPVLIVHGEADEVVTPAAVQKLVDKLRTQRHITIAHDTIPGANHFFENNVDELLGVCAGYLDRRLAMVDAA